MKEFCHKHTEKAKAKFYEHFFNEYHGNSKKQWHMMNRLLNRARKKINATKLTDKDGNSLTSSLDIAAKFNDYFSNIATNLKNRISTGSSPMAPNEYKSYLDEPTLNYIFLSRTCLTDKTAGSCESFRLLLASVVTKSL